MWRNNQVGQGHPAKVAIDGGSDSARRPLLRQWSGAQGVRQRRGIDQSTSGSVDQDGARFHLCQFAGADQVAGVVGERAVQRGRRRFTAPPETGCSLRATGAPGARRTGRSCRRPRQPGDAFASEPCRQSQCRAGQILYRSAASGRNCLEPLPFASINRCRRAIAPQCQHQHRACSATVISA